MCLLLLRSSDSLHRRLFFHYRLERSVCLKILADLNLRLGLIRDKAISDERGDLTELLANVCVNEGWENVGIHLRLHEVYLIASLLGCGLVDGGGLE